MNAMFTTPSGGGSAVALRSWAWEMLPYHSADLIAEQLEAACHFHGKTMNGSVLQLAACRMALNCLAGLQLLVVQGDNKVDIYALETVHPVSLRCMWH